MLKEMTIGEFYEKLEACEVAWELVKWGGGHEKIRSYINQKMCCPIEVVGGKDGLSANVHHLGLYQPLLKHILWAADGMCENTESQAIRLELLKRTVCKSNPT